MVMKKDCLQRQICLKSYVFYVQDGITLKMSFWIYVYIGTICIIHTFITPSYSYISTICIYTYIYI